MLNKLRFTKNSSTMILPFCREIYQCLYTVFFLNTWAKMKKPILIKGYIERVKLFIFKNFNQIWHIFFWSSLFNSTQRLVALSWIIYSNKGFQLFKDICLRRAIQAPFEKACIRAFKIFYATCSFVHLFIHWFK